MVTADGESGLLWQVAVRVWRAMASALPMAAQALAHSEESRLPQRVGGKSVCDRGRREHGEPGPRRCLPGRHRRLAHDLWGRRLESAERSVVQEARANHGEPLSGPWLGQWLRAGSHRSRAEREAYQGLRGEDLTEHAWSDANNPLGVCISNGGLRLGGGEIQGGERRPIWRKLPGKHVLAWRPTPPTRGSKHVLEWIAPIG